MSGLYERLERDNLRLLESASAPALVTVVNSSRLISDIKRELARVPGRS